VARIVPHAERGGDGWRDKIRRSDRRQGDEPDAVVELSGRLRGGRDGQTRLAHTTRASHHQQAYVRAADLLAE
jgi:hypothetical protein